MRTRPLSCRDSGRRASDRHPVAVLRAHPLIVLAVAIILLGGVPLTRARARGSATAAGGELSVLFVGMTNAPTPMMPMLAITRAQGDLYALFALTNTSKDKDLEFFTLGAEKWDGTQWHEFIPAVGGPTNYWREVTGARVLPPSGGCVAAAAWPTGLAASNAWRLRLSVALAPLPLFKAANNAFGKEIFQPRRRRTTASPEVSPSP